MFPGFGPSEMGMGNLSALLTAKRRRLGFIDERGRRGNGHASKDVSEVKRPHW